MNRFETAAMFLIVAAVVLTAAGNALDSLWPLFVAVGLLGLTLSLGVLDSLLNPTKGKTLFTLGLGLLAAPIVLGLNPLLALAGIVVLTLARGERIGEVSQR